jgi:hypothetical protein
MPLNDLGADIGLKRVKEECYGKNGRIIGARISWKVF